MPALKIGKGKSSKAWGDVDKGVIWGKIKAAIEEKAENALSVAREVYAVLKVESAADLTQGDCWGPHHEIQEDGTVVLNVSGLEAAAAALAGARSEPSLSGEQKMSAAKHLLRHYRELEKEPPESLLDAAGEMRDANKGVFLLANLTGEMSVNDVPLAPGVDVAALKAGDSDPLEVVVGVPVGMSKRGWYYRAEALKDIVQHVMTHTLSGFRGHQKAEDINTEFRDPVTHWVGAKFDPDREVKNEKGEVVGKGVAFFRGVVDRVAPDLKRWIRTNRIKQVSIFGFPRLQSVNGETHVTGYRPLSIDWTPLDRPGMPTWIAAIGEMDAIGGEFAPAGAVHTNYKGGTGGMDLLTQLKEAMAKGEIKISQLAAVLGWKGPQVVGEIDPGFAQAIEADSKAAKAFGEICTVLGVQQDKADKALERVKALITTEGDYKKAAHDALVKGVLEEKVAGEIRPLVSRMLNVQVGANKADVEKAVGEILASDEVKGVLARMFKDGRIPDPKQNNKGNNEPQFTRTRRQAI